MESQSKEVMGEYEAQTAFKQMLPVRSAVTRQAPKVENSPAKLIAGSRTTDKTKIKLLQLKDRRLNSN